MRRLLTGAGVALVLAGGTAAAQGVVWEATLKAVDVSRPGLARIGYNRDIGGTLVPNGFGRRSVSWLQTFDLAGQGSTVSLAVGPALRDPKALILWIDGVALAFRAARRAEPPGSGLGLYAWVGDEVPQFEVGQVVAVRFGRGESAPALPFGGAVLGAVLLVCATLFRRRVRGAR